MAVTEVYGFDSSPPPRVEYSGAIKTAAEERGMELCREEITAVDGLLNGKLEDNEDCGLRFDIINAEYRRTHNMPVDERHLALHGIFHTLVRPKVTI